MLATRDSLPCPTPDCDGVLSVFVTAEHTVWGPELEIELLASSCGCEPTEDELADRWLECQRP